MDPEVAEGRIRTEADAIAPKSRMTQGTFGMAQNQTEVLSQLISDDEAEFRISAGPRIHWGFRQRHFVPALSPDP